MLKESLNKFLNRASMGNKNKETVVVVSGGFDPVHIGHLRMFQDAKRLGDKLIVVLNCDDWLLRKKGKFFMCANDRAEIIKEFACVDEVYILESSRDDVTEALEDIKPDVFANGGDRKNTNDIPEYKYCEENGVEMIFNIGGGKIRSSTDLLTNYKK